MRGLPSFSPTSSQNVKRRCRTYDDGRSNKNVPTPQVGSIWARSGVTNLLDVAILVGARTRRQIARCAQYSMTRHEGVTGQANCVRWNMGKESVLGRIRQSVAFRNAPTSVSVGSSIDGVTRMMKTVLPCSVVACGSRGRRCDGEQPEYGDRNAGVKWSVE